MCRSDVEPQAQEALASVLTDIAEALAAEHGLPSSEVTIGPVDLGGEHAWQK